MSVEAIIGWVSVGCTGVGAISLLAYHSGRLSVRVEALEQWRAEMHADMHGLHDAITDLKQMLLTMRHP